jgi:hypothetical protein
MLMHFWTYGGGGPTILNYGISMTLSSLFYEPFPAFYHDDAAFGYLGML